jgi:hypothetical protein
LLTIAAVLDGASGEDPAKTGGMDRQTLRDLVICLIEQGLEQEPHAFGRAESQRAKPYARSLHCDKVIEGRP